MKLRLPVDSQPAPGKPRTGAWGTKLNFWAYGNTRNSRIARRMKKEISVPVKRELDEIGEAFAKHFVEAIRTSKQLARVRKKALK
jgi:hypothetical protein